MPKVSGSETWNRALETPGTPQEKAKAQGLQGGRACCTKRQMPSEHCMFSHLFIKPLTN